MEAQGGVGPNVGGRTWLIDADRPSRRLAIHAHPDKGEVSLSLWDGNTCRATFHLPLGEVPRLVYDLAAALEEAVEWEGTAPASPHTATGWTLPRPVAPAAQMALDVVRKVERTLAGHIPAQDKGEQTRSLRVVSDEDLSSG